MTFNAAVGGVTALASLVVTGGGGITIRNVTTAGGVQTYNSGVILGASALLDTTNSGGSAAGATISLGAVTGAAFNLSLHDGHGGEVNGTSFTGTGTLGLQTIGGTASFTGAVSPATLTVPNTVVNVSLSGTGGTITNLVQFHNTGTLGLGQAAGTMTFSGGVNTTAAPAVGGAITLYGTIRTAGQPITLGAVGLGAATGLDTTNGGGSPAGGGITLGTVDGGFALTVQGGTGGAVTFNAAVGGVTALASLVVTGGGGITIRNVTTAGGVQTYNSGVILGASALLDTTNSGGSAAGATISLGAVTGAAFNLTLQRERRRT